MSRVLALTRELPYPPNAGDRIVTYGFLRALRERHHEVHVLSYGRSGDDPAAAALDSFCASVSRLPRAESSLPAPLRKGVRAAIGRSDVMAMFDSPRFRQAAAHRIQSLAPEVVLAQHPYMGQCFLDGGVEAALAATGADPVTSAHVIEYLAHRRHRRHARGMRTRLALTAELPVLRRAELQVYERSARTLVLGHTDLTELEARIASPVRCQRVGLDISTYDPGTRANGPPGAATDDGGRGGRAPLVFFGSYDWFPNADAARYLCERIFPKIRARHDNTELVLAGRGADDAVRAYDAIKGVRFVGNVGDLASLVKNAAAVIAPLRIGGGTRIKVLESMAWGVPVVTTPAGAEGVNATAGEDFYVASSVEEFVTKTIRLLECPSERVRVGANARETVERRYSIAAIARELERNLGLA